MIVPDKASQRPLLNPVESPTDVLKRLENHAPCSGPHLGLPGALL